MKGYSYNSYKVNNSGFSLIEMLVTALIIGILGAIATPNLLGLFSHNRVKESIAAINGAIKETQRQAIRQGKQCRINIDTATNTISGNPTDCLLQQRDINDSIDIRTNLSGTPPNILFSAKGTTTKSGTIVVSSDTTDTQKCFVISLGLGITRTGDWNPDPGTPPEEVKTEFDGTCDSN